eukprot:2331121-Prymnesium_polylepis.2
MHNTLGSRLSAICARRPANAGCLNLPPPANPALHLHLQPDPHRPPQVEVRKIPGPAECWSPATQLRKNARLASVS